MSHSIVQSVTNFGKLLHKEGLWSMYQYEENKSLMYHLCRGFAGIRQDNYPVDPANSRCSACSLEAPDEIRGLWMIHNFDWIQRSADKWKGNR